MRAKASTIKVTIIKPAKKAVFLCSSSYREPIFWREQIRRAIRKSSVGRRGLKRQEKRERQKQRNETCPMPWLRTYSLSFLMEPSKMMVKGNPRVKTTKRMPHRMGTYRPKLESVKKVPMLVLMATEK